MKQKMEGYSDSNAPSFALSWITSKYFIKRWIWGMMVGTLLVGCQRSSSDEKQSRVDKLPYFNEANFTPLWLEDGSKEIQLLHQIPAFSLINQDGEQVTDTTFKGKVYVADFFFTSCPGICPKMTENMSLLQDEFQHDDDVLLLSHSVTPETDSVPILKKYAQEHHVTSGKWHLVTGNRDEIYQLGRQAYFIEENLGVQKKADEFLHTENFVLVDGNRHIRGIYNGLNKNAIQQLIADIRTLKQE
ncbi:SCO family protein [Limibacter armeniacum]|uniref:SCO family protein n=1 Tax=Limibacter armeniacum TaxID=466084 RepID=UPI002FE6918C